MHNHHAITTNLLTYIATITSGCRRVHLAILPTRSVVETISSKASAFVNSYYPVSACLSGSYNFRLPTGKSLYDIILKKSCKRNLLYQKFPLYLEQGFFAPSGTFKPVLADKFAVALFSTQKWKKQPLI